MSGRPESTPRDRLTRGVPAWAAGAALGLLIAGCAGPRLGGSEAELVLEDLLAPRASRLGARSPPVERTAVVATRPDASPRGDLYRAVAAPRAGVVLVPGLAPAGKDDGRIVALARTLARAGFLVYVPDVEPLRTLRITSGVTAILAGDFATLRARPELDVDAAIGFAAFSFAAGPTLLAALDDAIRARVAFVVCVGGYYDLVDLIAFITTGHAGVRRDGPAPPRLGRPSDESRWVIAHSVADKLPRPADRRAIAARALGALRGGEPLTVDDAIPGLGPEGQALLDLLANRDPSAVVALIDELPTALQAEIAALDPASRDLSALGAELVLVHGRADDFIPYTQSVALAEALPRGRARLFLLDGLAHVDLAPRQGDLPVLAAAVEALLAWRD